MNLGLNKKSSSKIARQFRGEPDEEEQTQPQSYGTWDAITGYLTGSDKKEDEEEEKKKQ